MKIKLQSGKAVYIEAFHCIPTYSGLLIGLPSKQTNEVLIKQITYPKEWGNKTYVLKKTDMYIAENILKPMINCALLTSEPTDIKGNHFDGSCVVAIWFNDEQFDKSLKEIIIKGLGYFDWDIYAENYQL